MKILFVVRSIYQFSYVESIVKGLNFKGHSITMLFDKDWSANHSTRLVESFLSSLANAQMGWSLRRDDSWRRLIFALREIRSYAGYLRRSGQSKYYRMRWKRYLPKPLKKIAGFLPVRLLLASDTVFRGLSQIERFVPPDARIMHSIAAHKPDAVVVSPMIQRFSEEVEYVKAAKAAGVPTVVPAYSWDVLTTKGLFHVIPDLFLAWNQLQREEAMHIHDIQDRNILITGSAFFDKWFDADRLAEDRERFCQRVGLDPQKPYLLYLGSSVNIAEDETWLIREISTKIKSHPDPAISELSILVRPHPANTKHYAHLDDDDLIVWPKEGELPQKFESQRDFYNSVVHSALTAGINTSGMIDAIIIGKPCLTVMAPQYRRTQEQAAHFKILLEADILEVAQNTDEAVDRIDHILQGVDSRALRRKLFRRDFARPLGENRPAGLVAAEVIEKLVEGIPVNQIRSRLNCYDVTKADDSIRTDVI